MILHMISKMETDFTIKKLPVVTSICQLFFNILFTVMRFGSFADLTMYPNKSSIERRNRAFSEAFSGL